MPIPSLAIVLQIGLALKDPLSDHSRQIIAGAHGLFIAEVVFMHSAIFWNAIDYLSKAPAGRLVLKIFLVVAYGLFIIPIAQQDLMIGFSYLVFCSLRFLGLEGPHWLQQTALFKNYLPPKDHRFILAIYALVKIVVVVFGLMLIAPFVPASPDLTVDLVKQITPQATEFGDAILEMKFLFLYFILMVVHRTVIKFIVFRKHSQ